MILPNVYLPRTPGLYLRYINKTDPPTLALVEQGEGEPGDLTYGGKSIGEFQYGYWFGPITCPSPDVDTTTAMAWHELDMGETLDSTREGAGTLMESAHKFVDECLPQMLVSAKGTAALRIGMEVDRRL